MKVIVNGAEYDRDAVVMLMDDDIREELANSGEDWQSEQEFIDAYCAAHLGKFGSEFVVN